MKIFGHLTTHNEFPDVLRAIESIYPVCDEILVTYSGKKGSTKLRQFLEERKDIYKMTVYDSLFVTLKEQRQFLLDRTPVDNWVVSIDADEKYSQAFANEARDCLLNKLSEKHYETARKGNIPLVISIPHYNLMNDILHYDGNPVFHNQKVFFYEKGLHWDFDDYFTHITYLPAPQKFNKDTETTVYSITGPKEWAILHYARLNPKRIAWRKTHLKDPRFGNYDKESWTNLRNGFPIVPKELPKEIY